MSKRAAKVVEPLWEEPVVAKKRSRKVVEETPPEPVKEKTSRRAKKSDANICAQVVPQLELKFDLDGPITKDQLVHFSKKDLFQFEMLQYKTAHAVQSVVLHKQKMADFERSVVIQRASLENELKSLHAVREQSETTLREFQVEIQAVYSVDLKQVTYDDVSGRIILHGPTTAQSQMTK